MRTGAKNTTAIHKLTALWALCESGLGGWMHALKLPFTGFFLGAFSIIIIALIASNTNNSFRKVMQATLIVVLIKAAVSPQSSPAAYFAVAFQGLAGAFFFRFVSFKIAAILLGVITMLESALQMVIIKTIIFGVAIWEAIDLLFAKVAEQFHLDASISFSMQIIGAYLLLYAVWGFILGIWIGRLPRIIAQRKAGIITRMDSSFWVNDATVLPIKKGRKQRKFLVTMLILLFIVAVYLAGQYSNINKAAFIVLRTIAIIGFFYWVVNPFINWLMQKWIASKKKDSEFYAIMQSLPEMRSLVRPAFVLSGNHKGLRRYREFILTLLVLSLYSDSFDEKSN